MIEYSAVVLRHTYPFNIQYHPLFHCLCETSDTNTQTAGPGAGGLLRARVQLHLHLLY